MQKLISDMKLKFDELCKEGHETVAGSCKDGLKRHVHQAAMTACEKRVCAAFKVATDWVAGKSAVVVLPPEDSVMACRMPGIAAPAIAGTAFRMTGGARQLQNCPSGTALHVG